MNVDSDAEQDSDVDDNFEDTNFIEEVEQLLTATDDIENITIPDVKDIKKSTIDEKEVETDDDDALDYDDDDIDAPGDVSVSQKIVFIDRIRAQDSRMPDVMSKATLVAIIIARSGILSRGARAFVKMKNGSNDPTRIAKAEIAHGVCPRSAVFDNQVEWKIKDYAYFPSDFINELKTIKDASVII
jgi:DNA-directed RNA polymerase subunit K/omega